MATLQFAGEYEILESKLTTSTGVTINISKLIAEINLFEDLFSNALYCSIFIVDTNNIISRGPIIGQERVHLKIAIPTVTSGEAAIDVIFNVYKVGTNTEVNKGGQLIELSMVTPEFLKNNRVRVSKSYSNSIDNIVQDILQLDETLIGTTKNVQIDATTGIRRMIVPNLHPYDIINNLATEAISTSGQPLYVFYETLKGLNFRSLENLYDEEIVAEYNASDFEVLKVGEVGKGQSKTGNLEKDYKRALDYSMNSYNDMLANVKSGMMGSTIIRYDPYYKTYQKKEFGYFSNFEESARTDANPIYNSNGLRDYPNARIHLQPGFSKNVDTSHYNTSTSSYGFSGSRIYESLQNRQSKFAELNMGASAVINVHGNFALNVGKSVIFNMPAVGDEDTDPRFTGRYLITTLRHSFRNSNKTSQTTLTLVKDSSAAPFINVASADSGVPTTASDAF